MSNDNTSHQFYGFCIWKIRVKRVQANMDKNNGKKRGTNILCINLKFECVLSNPKIASTNLIINVVIAMCVWE